MSLETPIAIRTLQRKLYRKAKQEPDFRFYLLYDKIYREDVLQHAYVLAKANQGAPGVDGQTFEAIESEGLERWMEERTARQDVPTTTGAAGVDPEARWRRAAARYPDDTRPDGANCREAGVGADLRSRSGARSLWLPTEAKRARRDPESAQAALRRLHRCSGR